MSVIILDATQDIETGSLESKVDELINTHDVIVFSKSTCPFCLGKMFLSD